MLPKFYMLVGISGSGKSFIANQLKNIYKKNIVICSSDEIRKELWGDENEQKNPQKVFQVLHKRVKKALKEGQNVVYDATNLTRKRRIAFLQELKKFSCYKSCLVVATPFNECIENNLKRERYVPVEVIKRQYESFQLPYFYEGWDSINIMNATDEDKLQELDNIIEELRDNPHDNPHHNYTIGNHILAARQYCVDKYLEVAQKLSKLMVQSSNDGELYSNKMKYMDKEYNEWYWASFVMKYHDIGKGFTKQFKDSKGNPSDIAHYYNHQNVSAYEIVSRMRFYELLKEDMPINYKSDFMYDQYWYLIAVLVNLHMEPFFKPYGSKAWEKFSNLIGEYLTNILIKSHEADLNSH